MTNGHTKNNNKDVSKLKATTKDTDRALIQQTKARTSNIYADTDFDNYTLNRGKNVKNNKQSKFKISWSDIVDEESEDIVYK